ncbi:MAG: septation protein IspZ [Parvularculaceae bacterium]|nr:septation protein IspZ [Parvularculaceae bacterium]
MTNAPAQARPPGLVMWTYVRRFRIDRKRRSKVVFKAGFSGSLSALHIDGAVVATDWTPLTGEGATRNHRLVAALDDGRKIVVEAGYVNWYDIGIAVRIDGALVHESHKGKKIAYPERLRGMAEARTAGGAPEVDMGKLARNRPAIIVDIATGILFFVVAKMTDLTTAALVGAGVGVLLLVVQRFLKNVDILGGLALFGIVLMLISAAYAVVVNDETMIQMRSTLLGGLTAALFFIDAAFGGRYLGERMSRYIVYSDIIPWRLSFGVGLTGLVLAGLNWLVVRYFSKDFWLFYTTFGDFVVAMIVFMLMLGFARGKMLPPRRQSS